MYWVCDAELMGNQVGIVLGNHGICLFRLFVSRGNIERYDEWIGIPYLEWFVTLAGIAILWLLMEGLR